MTALKAVALGLAYAGLVAAILLLAHSGRGFIYQGF